MTSADKNVRHEQSRYKVTQGGGGDYSSSFRQRKAHIGAYKN